MRVGIHRQSVRVFCKEPTTVHRKPQRQYMIPAQQSPSATSTAKSWAYLNGLVSPPPMNYRIPDSTVLLDNEKCRQFRCDPRPSGPHTLSFSEIKL